MPDNLPTVDSNTYKNTEIWITYILFCNDGSLYTGITTNIAKRLHQHNHCKSGSKYTRSRRPVELVYYEEIAGKSNAAKREYQIKQLRPIEKRKLITANWKSKKNIPEYAIDDKRVGEIINQLNNVAAVSPQPPLP